MGLQVPEQHFGKSALGPFAMLKQVAVTLFVAVLDLYATPNAPFESSRFGTNQWPKVGEKSSSSKRGP